MFQHKHVQCIKQIWYITRSVFRNMGICFNLTFLRVFASIEPTSWIIASKRLGTTDLENVNKNQKLLLLIRLRAKLNQSGTTQLIFKCILINFS